MLKKSLSPSLPILLMWENFLNFFVPPKQTCFISHVISFIPHRVLSCGKSSQGGIVHRTSPGPRTQACWITHSSPSGLVTYSKRSAWRHTQLRTKPTGFSLRQGGGGWLSEQCKDKREGKKNVDMQMDLLLQCACVCVCVCDCALCRNLLFTCMWDSWPIPYARVLNRWCRVNTSAHTCA